jgi:tripartite-type tricarboxylate transporter receptor subunit TctC
MGTKAQGTSHKVKGFFFRLPPSVFLLGCALAASIASAQPYPSRPIRVITTAPPGGTPDVVARMVTPGLSQALGQQFVVDNRPGAGGLIAAETVAKSAPDGYTLMICGQGPLTVLPHLQKQAGYDTFRDFAPVGLIAFGPFLLITHPSLPAKSVKELIALARSQPGRLNYGSAGNGAGNHLAMELFKSMTGVSITHVPYKGAPQAVADVVAGHMNMMFNSIPPVIGHLKAEKLRALGVAAARRSPQLPDVWTISEAGVPGFESGNWFGLLAPAKTPKAIVAGLNGALAKVVRAPEVRSLFEAQGTDPVGGSAEEFAAFIRREHDKYVKLVKLAGAKVD